MKNRKVNKLFFSAGLLCMAASFILTNYKLYPALQGFLTGFGLVITSASFFGKKVGKAVLLLCGGKRHQGDATVMIFQSYLL